MCAAWSAILGKGRGGRGEGRWTLATKLGGRERRGGLDCECSRMGPNSMRRLRSSRQVARNSVLMYRFLPPSRCSHGSCPMTVPPRANFALQRACGGTPRSSRNKTCYKVKAAAENPYVMSAQGAFQGCVYICVGMEAS